jgi:hypothetical protein
MARRKDLYEGIYPQTKNGGDKTSAKARAERRDSVLVPFAWDTAQKTGMAPRPVQTKVQIGKKLTAGGGHRRVAAY